jgi:hypothetical protein
MMSERGGRARRSGRDAVIMLQLNVAEEVRAYDAK